MNTSEPIMQSVIQTMMGVWSEGVKSIVRRRHHKNMTFYPEYNCGAFDQFLDWEDGRKLFE